MFVHEALTQVSNPLNAQSTIIKKTVPDFPATQYQEYSLLSPAVFISELLGGLNSYVCMSLCINNIAFCHTTVLLLVLNLVLLV